LLTHQDRHHQEVYSQHRHFIATFNNRDVRKDSPTDTTISPILTSVYNKIQRWEDVPNRCEPFTLEMLAEVHHIILDEDCLPDSLNCVLANWFQCGLFRGFCLSEYAQDAMHPDPRLPCLDARGATEPILLAMFISKLTTVVSSPPSSF
jgi:hypothetical protein